MNYLQLSRRKVKFIKV